ncbi:MAG: hypothetical protein KGZ80_04820 [Methylomonas sp.]|nr:hypothetical protein [Methylomonas sp.]PPD24055.1 MAG: hypothetical protein CTY22_11525 [Methylomonas sp.]PPD32414.1 MAG: hypothetical protein CTY21_11470 [Methylomonas sp.]PPD53182.1 MAG: hypothetical protein CTY11_07040 [Methylomonas sp.]
MKRYKLRTLVTIVSKESRHLQQTTERLFTQDDWSWMSRLEYDMDISERVEAFVGRFGRLQDTLGDKLIPLLLLVEEETPGTALDNLGKAERLGWLSSVADWSEARGLRNRMVHEYMEDIDEFRLALDRGRQLVPLLLGSAQAILSFIDSRNYLDRR